MDSEDREKLERTLELAEENHRMIRKLYRSNQWSRVWRIFYWVIILGISFGALYYLQPYVDRLTKVYSSFQSQIDAVQRVGNTMTQGLK